MSKGYNQLAFVYQQVDIKPDKRYSIIPTMLGIAGDLSGKTVLDMECGSGAYARAYAEAGAKRVMGIDRMEIQVQLAQQQPHPVIEYSVGDVFSMKLPRADVIDASFVLDSFHKPRQIEILAERLFRACHPGGRVILAANDPNGHPPRAQVVRKTLEGPKKDGVQMRVEFEKDGGYICTLQSHYFSFETIRAAFERAGFSNVTRHTSMVTEEGYRVCEPGYWDGYAENVELLFLSADKV